MHRHDLTNQDQAEPDHWEMYAEAMDLTIEGHRLIAEEIVHEVKLAWRGVASRLRGLAGAAIRRRSSPSV
jgi:hypothetical protein